MKIALAVLLLSTYTAGTLAPGISPHSIRLPFPYLPAKLPKRVAPKITPLIVYLDAGHGDSSHTGTSWSDRGHTFQEAAYTYRIVTLLGQSLTKEGIRVEYSVHSPVMDHYPHHWPDFHPLPYPGTARYLHSTLLLPKKIRTASRSPVTYGWVGLAARASWTTDPVHRNLYLSIHVDAPPSRQPGRFWQEGSLICLDPSEKGTHFPSFARTRATCLRAAHLTRHSHAGYEAIRTQPLAVLNPGNNCVVNRVLLEMGMPACSVRDRRLIETQAGQTKLVQAVLKAIRKWNTQTKSCSTSAPSPKSGGAFLFQL